MKVLFCVHSLLSQTSICCLKWIFAGFSVLHPALWLKEPDWSWRSCLYVDFTVRLNWMAAGRSCDCFSTASYYPSYYYLWLFYHFCGLGRWNWALWLRLVVVWLSAGMHLTSNRGVKVWKAGRKEVICWTQYSWVSWISLKPVIKICVISGEFFTVLCFSTSSFECPEKQKEFWILKTSYFWKLT